MKSFGEKVVSYRTRLGINQRTLAQLTHLSPSLLNRIEKGSRRPHSAQLVLDLIVTLRLTPIEAIDLAKSGPLPPFMQEEVIKELSSRDQSEWDKTLPKASSLPVAQLREVLFQLDHARTIFDESIQALRTITQPIVPPRPEPIILQPPEKQDSLVALQVPSKNNCDQYDPHQLPLLAHETRQELESIKHLIASIEKCSIKGTLSQEEDTLYPPTTLDKANAHLHGDRGHCPIWLLSPNGTILATNLLSFFLWGALQLTDSVINKRLLLGYNVFEVYIREENFSRIALPEKPSDFWFTKIIVERRLEDALENHVVTAFRNKILHHPYLKFIYLLADRYLGKEWSYFLKVRPPEYDFPFHRRDYLEFEASVERIEEGGEHKGYVVTCQPVYSHTKNFIEHVYQRLVDAHGINAFVQYQHPYTLTHIKTRS